MPRSSTFDIHQQITDHIVHALESAGEFQLPWISDKGSFSRPVNVASKQPYNGVNIITLWITALDKHYPSNIWGTYKQWQDQGCQVRKGEKSSLIVFYKTYEFDQVNADTGEAEQSERFVARASRVFNAEQVEGFVVDEVQLPEVPLFDPIERAEAFANSTGAIIEEYGDEACYMPSRDIIRMPERRRFIDTKTTSASMGFYSTLCHELVHWSGSSSRLERDLSGRFGDDAYAMEELIAELGAAFLCSDLGLTQEPRMDHACYIKNWLRILKDDKKAIFTAASKASQAANWLLAHEKSSNKKNAA
jgi:antirestriction protein ArdC